ncbi:head decoration protein (plasmid) [Orbus sturtevantii]|uniref:head decoration protein n=1 Tax=Orbus sturtevantii TaxID=3074109 RepID=UPI00370D5424
MTTYSDGSFQPGAQHDEFVSDNLIAGSLQLVTGTVQIAKSTKILLRGTILGRNESGEFLPCIKSATDGSQVPVAILVDVIDTTDGAKQGGIYRMGEFNKCAVIIDDSWNIDDITEALVKSTIYLKDTISA